MVAEFRLEGRGKMLKRLNMVTEAISGPGAVRAAEAIRQAVIDGNRQDRYEGLDKNGRPLIRWRVRKGDYEGATGETLNPFYFLSRSVALFRCDMSRAGAGWSLRIGWVGEAARILGYHARPRTRRGTKFRLPKRDILGLTPRTEKAARGVFQDFARGVFAPKGAVANVNDLLQRAIRRRIGNNRTFG